MQTSFLPVMLIVCVSLPACNRDEGFVVDDEAGLSSQELIGKRLFFDANLSEPRGMSCASCHDPDNAFAGNNGSSAGVAQGSRPGVLGFRNTPSAMYASFSPKFELVVDEEGSTPTGGQFLDGRVDTLSEQAKGPLLAEAEMNNPNLETVVAKVAASSYAEQFRQAYGPDIFADPQLAYDAIGRALEAFESTPRFHPFNSRYDAYIKGSGQLTAQERHGMQLFFDKDKGNCVACHVADPSSKNPQDSLFTDFTYDNLGVPRNPAIPANAAAGFFDLGLCGPKRQAPAGDVSYCGAFKVPTLRNVAMKQAFMHNGYFKNLRDVVAFYVTRDTAPERWYPAGEKFNDLPPEYRGNVNTTEAPYNRKPGDPPALTEAEIGDLTAFLLTLTDQPVKPN